MGKAIACCASLCLALCGCWFDGKLKHDFGTKPEPLDDGWEIATPAEVGLSSASLDRIHSELMREDRELGTLGLLVVKDGKLAFETYLRALDDRDHYHHIQSMTKSVTSLALGIASDEGHVASLELTTGELFPDAVKGLDRKKSEITLRELLTMRSGLAFDNDDFSVEMWVDKPHDPLRYMLAKPLYANPGERFYYRDVDPQLVGYALEKLARPEGTLVHDAIFAKLGITDYEWERGPDGVFMAAHGLHLRPRDVAKLGQLLLDRGMWRGERVVSADWIDQATSQQALSTYRDGKGALYPYGYYFWLVPGLGFAGWGHGGQFMFVVPDRKLVIVQIALPDSDDLQGSTLNDFLELVDPLLH